MSERTQWGFTLVEATLTLSILATVVFIVSQLIASSGEAQDHAVRGGRAVELNQELLDEIRTELVSSVWVLGNDATGVGYESLLDRTRARPGIAGSLPAVRDDGGFGREPSTGAWTGNELLFARHARTDGYRCASGRQHRLDVYRLVLYYLAAEGGGPRAGSPVGLDLCRWVGEPMVDALQVVAIADPADRDEILLHLQDGTPDVEGVEHRPVRLVWRLGGDPAVQGTFQAIESGSLVDFTVAPANPDWRIEQDPDRSSDGRLSRRFSVATNHAISAMGVGLYSVPSNTGDGFPHGFEVQVVGPSSARQVLVQLAVVSTIRPGLPAFSTLRSAVAVRDL